MSKQKMDYYKETLGMNIKVKVADQLITTLSGSRYMIVDNKITRLSEVPILESRSMKNSDTIIAGEEIIWMDPPAIGCRLLFTTNKGPITTSIITNIEKGEK